MVTKAGLMKIILVALALIAFPPALLGQEKGVDTQTRTIKKGNGPTNRGNDIGKTIDFGGGKTKVRSRFDNPYRMNSRRDVLIKMITSVLTDENFLIDESASRFDDGLIVTQPKLFARGPIITKNELFRYAIVPATDQVWTRGRYFLTVDVQSIDGLQNDISVVATVEGRSENGIFSEWSTLDSSGVAEDEFLSKLLEYAGVESDPAERKP